MRRVSFSRNHVFHSLSVSVLLCVCFSFGPVQAQKSDPLKSRQQVDLERAHFLVTQAFDEDEKGNDDEAVELYTQAVELCLSTVCLSLLVTSFGSPKDQLIFGVSATFSCRFFCFCVCNSPMRPWTRRCRLS